MLSFAPGSACDVCLEPFGAELKAPCSIPCGHVFCVSCLHHIARPTCPLCRTPFETRHISRLHIDLEPPRAHFSPDESVVLLGNDEGARVLQQRITELAMAGATEAQTTQLTDECKRFLDSVPKHKYSDLRTANKMLKYMCHVKHLYVEQGRTVNRLARSETALTQEIERLKAAIEVLKIDKRRLEQAWQTISAEKESTTSECQKLYEQLDGAEAQIVLLTEQNAATQSQLELVTKEFERLQAGVEFSSPEGDSPADLLDFPPDLPPSTSPDPHWPHSSLNLDPDPDNHDPTAPFLTPWESFTEPKALPDADLPEDPEAAATQCRPNGVYCGAAGCPHSCDCMPFLLFSPGSREAAAANGAPSMSALFTSPGAPSGLSLSLNQARARSSSRSRPRSRSLSRAPSPAPGPSDPPSASPIPSMSSSINIPNPHQELRGQLKDLLRDPPMSSSLPNMPPPSHFLPSPLSRDFRYGDIPATKDRAAAKPRDAHLHPPMLSHSSTPSPLHTSSTLADVPSAQRPSLLRMGSNTSQAADDRERDRERRRADQARASPVPVPMPRPQTHSAVSVPPPTSQAQASTSPLRPQGPSLRGASPAIPIPRPQAFGGPPPISSPSNVHPPQMPRPQAHSDPLPIPSPSNPHPSRSRAMPRPQAHGGPSPLPIPSPSNVHPPQPQPQPQSQSQSYTMPRAQAHAPSPTKPTSASSSQQRSHAASASTYGTHGPARAPAMAAPLHPLYA